MKVSRRLLTSSAVWAAPLALGITLLYFFLSFEEDYSHSKGDITYAPEIVSLVLNPAAALAYAAASSLSAWESGRLKDSGVWTLAPARSRYRIAVHALLPVLALSWAMLLLPVLAGLARENTAPTVACLPLLAVTMAVAVAHCVMGFAVGGVLPRLIAAPALALGVFYAVAASAAQGEVFWPRHLSGQFVDALPFGTTLPWKVAAPPLLCAGGIAVGLALLWVTPRSRSARTAIPSLALLVAAAGVGTGYGQVRTWGASAPVSVGHARMACAGSEPEVCVPVEGHADPDRARETVLATAQVLSHHGVHVELPHRISDNIINGSRAKPSTPANWWLPLTVSQRNGSTRYEALRRSLNLPCRNPSDAVAAYTATLWAADVVGEQRRYTERLRGELLAYDNGRQRLHTMQARVDDVRKLSRSAQARWYASELQRACADRPAPGSH
ncbi:hypothetical protein DEH18_16975 [Streptomyces sp. NHF165]|uniref:hypothetical protein n=1 Tax=Streptomyces sp. NHF165 TaxID=2175864 RepID=UPI00132EB23F|nr:hypothetical protein [Streptomyces sp. NHF165]QHF95272.1 hypothetical protein DEH18_16975 [Streptomyces sp. NHF165]